MLVTGWDVATRRQLFRRRRVEDAYRNALTADGRTLAAAHAGPANRPYGRQMGSGPMHLEDVASGEKLLTFPTLAGQTVPMVFSPDGRLLISYTDGPQKSGQRGVTLRLWEVLTATELQTFPTSFAEKAAFTPDGRLLALPTTRKELLVWDLSYAKELHRFKGFDAQVTLLAFSPDGRRLVSGLSDSTLLVWDAASLRDKARPVVLGAEGAWRAWDDLAADAHKAFAARWTLATAPDQAVPLLRERLKPAQAADAERVRKLIADLDSGQFAVRERARKGLADLGELAEPALRRTLADKPSLEARRQIQGLLDNLRAPVTRPETLRALRGSGAGGYRLAISPAGTGAIGPRNSRGAVDPRGESVSASSESSLHAVAMIRLRAVNLRRTGNPISPNQKRHVRMTGVGVRAWPPNLKTCSSASPRSR